MEERIDLIPLILMCIVMVPAMLSDIRQRRISNGLCLFGFCAGILLHFWLGGWGGASWAMLSGLALLVSMFGLFAIGVLGAGDVKLLAAAGAIGGTLTNALMILLATALCGGVLGVFMMLRQRTRIRVESLPGERSPETPASHAARGRSVPYAVAIGIGSVLTLAWGLHQV
jgi:prepilin peptidase CpaA